MTNHLIGFGTGAGATGIEIDRTLGTNIGDMTSAGGLAAAFDGTTNQANGACARKLSTQNAYVGKTGNISRIISKVTVYGSNDLDYFGGSGTVQIFLYAKTGAAPANSTDGTLLGSISFTEVADESTGRDITSSDTSNLWAHWWVTMTIASGATSGHCGEARFFE